jgi:hypothetical protein
MHAGYAAPNGLPKTLQTNADKQNYDSESLSLPQYASSSSNFESNNRVPDFSSDLTCQRPVNQQPKEQSSSKAKNNSG